MIIWGWGGGKAKDLGPALPFQCSRCGREGFARYFTVTKWFRLYFIPIIPYQTKHFLVCPVCTAATELTTKTERDHAERLVSLTASLMSGATDEQRYRELVAAEVDGGTPPMLAQRSALGATPQRPDPAEGVAGEQAIRDGGL